MKLFSRTGEHRSLLSLLVTIVFLSGIVLQGCRDEQAPTSSSQQGIVTTDDVAMSDAPIEGQYIVVFKSTLGKTNNVAATVNLLLEENGISADAVQNVYSHSLNGFTVRMTSAEADAVKKNSSIAYIEQDRVITLAKPGGGGGGLPAQTTPWGIARVGGAGNGVGKVAWIIDTGVDLDHPDLTVDVARSRNFVSTTSTADDDNGHGTHCAGIIAAKNNTVGVVGVAAGATVVAVKVLNRRGSGTYSQIIAGVDYVAANGANGDVANMSLGGSASQALDDAVVNAASKGIKFALAAGNESTNAGTKSPARANGANIYTISAMASGDNWASYSNYGNPPVDYCAPGSSILSLWKDGGTNTISGTSMATPHVAGILLLGNVASDGTVKNDPDGNPDPIAHR
ncbi:MAG: S8 family serine peptidase [Bacteroidota bacterium]